MRSTFEKICILSLIILFSLSVTSSLRAQSETENTENRFKATLYKSSGNVLFANALQEFSLKAKDTRSGVANIYYSINETPFVRYQQPFRLNEAGLNRVRYYAIDQSGNKEQVQSYQVYLDNQGPELAFELDASAYYEQGIYYVKKNTSIVLNAFDHLSGVKALYLNRGRGVEKFEANQAFQVQQNGRLVFEAWGIDHTLNQSKPLQIQLLSDDTPPQIEILSKFRIYKERRFCPINGRLEIKASDDLSGLQLLQYKFKGDSDWRTYVNPILIQGQDSQSNFNVVMRAKDRSGNFSQEISYNCIYDNQRPQTNISF